MVAFCTCQKTVCGGGSQAEKSLRNGQRADRLSYWAESNRTKAINGTIRAIVTVIQSRHVVRWLLANLQRVWGKAPNGTVHQISTYSER